MMFTINIVPSTINQIITWNSEEAQTYKVHCATRFFIAETSMVEFGVILTKQRNAGSEFLIWFLEVVILLYARGF